MGMSVVCGFVALDTEAPCVRPAVTFAILTPEARVPCCAVCLETVGLPTSGEL